MKTIKRNINSYLRALLGLSLVLGLSACGLNSSEDGTIRANLRGSSRGGSVTSLTNGGNAIDLPVNRPANTSQKWTYVAMPKANLESFLTIAEGQQVIIDPNNFNHVESFFWGDMRSTNGTLQIGNAASEQSFFNSLDKNKFLFELTIWDYFTDGLNSQGQRYDYLGYAYFGRGISTVQAGELADVVYRDAVSPIIGLKFTDNLGDIVIEATLNRSTRIMSGNMYFRATGQQSLSYLGQFNNLRACEMFQCS